MEAEIASRFCLDDDLISIGEIDGPVAIPMKHNRGIAVLGPVAMLQSGCGPLRIAIKADGRSDEAPHANPECTPIAA
jgi:hypothetical protein